jgi:hypothetical protein
MQTLGLSSETKRSDGPLKSLLWPTIDNAWDVDYLGRQGLWVCTLVAIVSFVGSILTANPLIIFIGLLASAFYLLGAMGVRQVSWPAAALVLAVYGMGLLQSFVTLQFPNIFKIAITLVLASNVRAAFLAAQWRPAAEGEDRPTRFDETLADKYTDQWPQYLWPRLQIPFIVLGLSMLLFSLLGLGFVFAQRLGAVHPR